MPSQSHLRRRAFARRVTIALDPDARHAFVLDNLNIHCSATLVDLAAQRCGIEGHLGKKGKQGVLKSQESRQEFLSDPSHRTRFAYTAKHSSWLNLIEIAFGVIARKVVRRGSFPLGGRPAYETAGVYRMLQPGVRQAIQVDLRRTTLPA